MMARYDGVCLCSAIFLALALPTLAEWSCKKVGLVVQHNDEINFYC